MSIYKPIIIIFIIFAIIITAKIILKHNESTKHKQGVLNIEYVKDTELDYLKESFETESDEAIFNCNYRRISSTPGNIMLNNQMKGSYLDEMRNDVLEGFFRQYIKYDKNRHKDLLNGKIYYFENKDKYFKEKLAFYLSNKFESYLKTILELREFQIKYIYIDELRQPDMRTSRSYYVNFDVLIYRNEKNHGKHLKCLAEILDIKSLSRLSFNLVLYSVKVLGIVMEDKMMFDSDPFNMNTYEFLEGKAPFHSSGFSPS